MKGEQFIFFASVLAIWYHSSGSEEATWEWEERIIAKVKQNKKRERAKAPTKQNKKPIYVLASHTAQELYLYKKYICEAMIFLAAMRPLDFFTA